jgi:hypothetical protein
MILKLWEQIKSPRELVRHKRAVRTKLKGTAVYRSYRDELAEDTQKEQWVGRS